MRQWFKFTCTEHCAGMIPSTVLSRKGSKFLSGLLMKSGFNRNLQSRKVSISDTYIVHSNTFLKVVLEKRKYTMLIWEKIVIWTYSKYFIELSIPTIPWTYPQFPLYSNFPWLSCMAKSGVWKLRATIWHPAFQKSCHSKEKFN